MPGSDDEFDLVHTFNQAQQGKSKTKRPAPRELGRDGAAVELFIGTEIDESALRTPPSGVHYLFFNTSGNLRVKNSAGTVEDAGGGAPADGSYVTVNSESGLSNEQTVANTDVTNFDGSAGTASQLLQTDGTNLSFVDDPSPNEPDWSEDGNSPATISGSTDVSLTLNGTYDQVQIVGVVENNSGSGQDFSLQVNGDTGTNYDFVDQSGTRTTGSSNSGPLTRAGNGQVRQIYVLLEGRWNNKLIGHSRQFDSTADQTVSFENDSVTSPLDSVTVLTGGTADARVEAFGRDIGSGGIP